MWTLLSKLFQQHFCVVLKGLLTSHKIQSSTRCNNVERPWGLKLDRCSVSDFSKALRAVKPMGHCIHVEFFALTFIMQLAKSQRWIFYTTEMNTGVIPPSFRFHWTLMTSQKEQCPQGLCGVTIFRSVWGQLCQYREAFAILTTHLASILLPQPACCSVLDGLF